MKSILKIILFLLFVFGAIFSVMYYFSIKKSAPVVSSPTLTPNSIPTTATPTPVYNESTLNLTKTKLATIPVEYNFFVGPVFSPNGRKVAYIVKKEKQYFVVVNEKEGNLYDEILPIWFSPDNLQFAYAAKKNNKWFMVINNIEGKSYEKVFGGAFSPDSKRFIYAAKKGEGKLYVVTDSIESKEYESVLYPIFSPDSQKVAYTGERNGKWYMVNNNVEGNAYDEIMYLELRNAITTNKSAQVKTAWSDQICLS